MEHKADFNSCSRDTGNTATNNRKALSLAFWLNLVFSVIELIGGIVTNSTAIMTDALHDFTDAMTIGLAVWLEKISRKSATDTFTFGFKRFSLLSALGMSLFLLIGSVVMAISAVKALITPEAVSSQGMLGLAVLGIVVNGAAFFNIKNGGSHNHAHNHAHSHTHNHSSDNLNQNSKAIMLHLLEDLLGWIAVLVGATIIYFTNWFWVDAVLAILIAVYIGYNACCNIYETMGILLLSVPKEVDVGQLKEDIQAVPNVQRLDDLKVWSIDGIEHIALVTVTVQDSEILSTKETISAITTAITTLCNEAGILTVNVQVD